MIAAEQVPALDSVRQIANESESVKRAQLSQQRWAATPLAGRLGALRSIRNQIAGSGLELCDLFSNELVRTRAQSLISEIIPLAEACRFLEQQAKRILAPSFPSTRSRPFWLRGVAVEIRREPLGVVLLIGPANYPLFVPGVQALQALAAGNAVILKPGRGGARLANTLRQFAIQAGIPENLFQVLDERIESAQYAIASGVDKIVLTGSVETGRSVYYRAAGELIPVVMELSGCDPVFIQESANLARAVDAIIFGLQWNGGDTCIAPRRIFVVEAVAEEFEKRMCERWPRDLRRIPITRVRDDEAALEEAAKSPYGLGATVFGETSAARTLAARIRAGVVVLNDTIVPTADPRVPFGGRRASGFGTTRGAEGLLQFTVPKAVVIQNGKRLRHLEPLPGNAQELFAAYLKASHNTNWHERFWGWRQLLAALMGSKRKEQ